MLRRVLASVAAVALTAGAANAQFLLFSDENGNKQVVNRYAGERMVETRPFERRAARIPRAGDGRFSGDRTFRGRDHLTPGAPVGSDPYSGEKVVVGE